MTKGDLFAVDKPKGPTSHDVMYQIKHLFPGEKVGHAGTLDPLASGVLVVGVGRQATKLLHLEELNEKEYLATIRLGQTSTTDDAEGKKTAWPTKHLPTEQEVAEALKRFTGTIRQVPPAYSAVKLSGTPAYKLARRGQKTDLKEREAFIKEIELLSYAYPLLKIRVVTGRGVYIRSLARDLGQVLGVGGHIEELRRTRVGRFTVEDAVPIDRLAEVN